MYLKNPQKKINRSNWKFMNIPFCWWGATTICATWWLLALLCACGSRVKFYFCHHSIHIVKIFHFPRPRSFQIKHSQNNESSSSSCCVSNKPHAKTQKRKLFLLYVYTHNSTDDEYMGIGHAIRAVHRII